MALQSSPSFSYGFSYDVFLNFRGSDTRYGFTGNLYRALCDKGIRSFIDDKELQQGDEITPSLVKAIEESRIFIPVFSIDYASSSFCLDELVHIMYCFKEKGRLVLPVFYDVDPSHLRRLTGSYAEALAKHEERFRNNMERVQKWRMALNRVADFSGHHVNPRNEYEYRIIENIVKEVSNKINRKPLHVVNYPVGLQSQSLQLNSLLDVGYDDRVQMLGIYGIGGMGKTTLAKEIYNSIADQFEGLCFLHNVRENSAKHGLEHLQEELLSKTIGLKIRFGDVSEGIPIIKQRLQEKKVLLIIDDVNELKQLQVIVGDPDWLGPGSRVIITTRDKHLLARHGIYSTYEANGLNEDEALKLLRWNAFKNNEDYSSYEDILNRVVAYASGLPLALEVVGSNLYGKTIQEWKSLLDEYERIPNKEIQKILKVSYDALEIFEQDVFLDIACCFKGYRLAQVERILCAHHGQCIKYHIGVLVEKSLIKISQWCLQDNVTLHDLIEDMGKEIVRQESPKDPGERSRLWFHKDIVQVLEENSGTSKIEIIYLDFPLYEEAEQRVVEWEGDEFKKMRKLKTLIIENGCFSKGPKHLPKSLRVLEWCRYPSQNIPSDLCPKELSICKLRGSCFTSCELAGSLKMFMNMRELNFDDCQCLTQILDVSSLPNLEKISIRDCKNLITIHESVGFLNKLKILDAEHCCKLTSFPPIKSTSLQELKLSYCKRLKSFPEILGDVENITQINLFGTSIKELPFSFQNLTGLETLYLGGSGMLRLTSSIFMMPKLTRISFEGCQLPNNIDELSSTVSPNVHKLRLTNCNLPDEFLPIILTRFANVAFLDLSENNFTILPECLKECRNLSKLFLGDCKWLQEIRGIPPNLRYLSALGCKPLTSSCISMLLDQKLREVGGTTFCFAGTVPESIPEWFEHQSSGSSISFWFRNSLPSSIALFVHSIAMCKGDSSSLRAYMSINSYKYPLGHLELGLDVDYEIRPDHTYLYDVRLQDMGVKYKLEEELLKNEWIHAEITFEEEEEGEDEDEDEEDEEVQENRAMILKELDIKSGTPLLHIASGIHIFKQKTNKEDIQFSDPDRKRKLDEYLNSSPSQFHPLLSKGWVKVNCDVVSLESNAAAYGYILRDHLGSFLGGFVGQLGEIPILHAELKAILYGIQFSWNRGYRKVIVESNSLSAIELLREECPPNLSCSNLVREIHILSGSAGEVVWSHTLRQGNGEADGLANFVWRCLD